jgi:hypothetical protein
MPPTLGGVEDADGTRRFSHHRFASPMLAKRACCSPRPAFKRGASGRKLAIPRREGLRMRMDVIAPLSLWQTSFEVAVDEMLPVGIAAERLCAPPLP